MSLYDIIVSKNDLRQEEYIIKNNKAILFSHHFHVDIIVQLKNNLKIRLDLHMCVYRLWKSSILIQN